jgi:sRNA-binding regulator protein Hfq
MRGREPIHEDPEKERERERAKALAANGMPFQMAVAVAQNRLTLDEALERLARRAKVDRLMREHDLSRALATQVVLGQANLDSFLMKRRLALHRETHMNRSCLDAATQDGSVLLFGMHGQRKMKASVRVAEAYQVVVMEEGATDPEELHKLQFMYAYRPEDWKRVRKVLKRDKVLSKAPRTPIERPQDRYTCSDKRMFRYVDTAVLVDVVLLEGDTFRGAVEWFGRYELGLRIKGDVVVTIFRHALHRLSEVS